MKLDTPPASDRLPKSLPQHSLLPHIDVSPRVCYNTLELHKQLADVKTFKSSVRLPHIDVSPRVCYNTLELHKQLADVKTFKSSVRRQDVQELGQETSPNK